MTLADIIEAADLAEEEAAAQSLHDATSKDALISAWRLNAEHFTGAAKERLREEYSIALVKFAPLSRAG